MREIKQGNMVTSDSIGGLVLWFEWSEKASEVIFELNCEGASHQGIWRRDVLV